MLYRYIGFYLRWFKTKRTKEKNVFHSGKRELGALLVSDFVDIQSFFFFFESILVRLLVEVGWVRGALFWTRPLLHSSPLSKTHMLCCVVFTVAQ